MSSKVVSAEDLSKPIIRKKSVSVSNEGTMKAVIDAGEFGKFVTDEPVPHGGTGEGPSPLQAVRTVHGSRDRRAGSRRMGINNDRRATARIVIGRQLARLLDGALWTCTFECCGTAAIRVESDRLAQWARSWGEHVAAEAAAELSAYVVDLEQCITDTVAIEYPRRGTKSCRRDTLLADARRWQVAVLQAGL